VHKEEIDLTRRQEDLLVRVGSFTRHVPLPRAVARLRTAGAKMQGQRLVITFAEEGGS
jgi:arsenite-transporting ATPase